MTQCTVPSMSSTIIRGETVTALVGGKVFGGHQGIEDKPHNSETESTNRSEGTRGQVEAELRTSLHLPPAMHSASALPAVVFPAAMVPVLWGNGAHVQNRHLGQPWDPLLTECPRNGSLKLEPSFQFLTCVSEFLLGISHKDHQGELFPMARSLK